MKTHRILSAALLLAAITTPVSHAGLVVSNLSEPAAGFNAAIGPLGAGAFAQMFTTPASGPGWTLDSLTFRLKERGTTSSSLAVSLYSDLSGTPGSLLGTLTGADPDGDLLADYTYTTTGISLAPNTSYFALLAADSSAPNGFEWQATSSNSQTGDPDWTIADISRFNQTGTTWLDDTTLKMSVSATAVPEPTALSLLGLGGLALLRRRHSA